MDVPAKLSRRRADRKVALPIFVRQKVVPRVVLVVMSILFLIPLYWMIVTALKNTAELTTFPPTFWPLNPKWENFVRAIKFFPFGTYLFNTLSITVLSVVGALISNLFIAYGFSRIEWPGRDAIFFLVVATIFIPFPATIVPLFIIFAKLNWVNTFLPLIAPMFFGHPLYIFMLRQYLMRLPMELSDAARVDGANEFQILRYVIFPLCKPALAVVGIFAAVYAWNDFLGPLVYLQDESKYTLAIGLQFFRSVHDVKFNLLMGASAVVMLPIIVIFLMFQKAFIEGVTMGSLK